MKVCLSPCLLLLGFVLYFPTHAQSLFYFSNWYVVDAPVYDAEGSPLAGPDFVAELYGGALPDSLSPAVEFGTLDRVMEPFLTGNSAGYFGNRGVAISGVPYYESAWLQVRAWDTRLGATYEEAVALEMGGYGASLVFSAQGANPFADPPELPAPLIGLQSFSLLPIVPEPSSFVLAGLGAAALLIFSRRK